MDTLAQVCTAVAAVVLIGVFPFEAFLIDRPWVQSFLGIEPHGIANVHLWSFCIGARNALAGIGALVGLWILHSGDEFQDWGTNLVPPIRVCLGADSSLNLGTMFLTTGANALHVRFRPVAVRLAAGNV